VNPGPQRRQTRLATYLGKAVVELGDFFGVGGGGGGESGSITEGKIFIFYFFLNNCVCTGSSPFTHCATSAGFYFIRLKVHPLDSNLIAHYALYDLQFISFLFEFQIL
jgi:hypothetical protein